MRGLTITFMFKVWFETVWIMEKKCPSKLNLPTEKTLRKILSLKKF